MKIIVAFIKQTAARLPLLLVALVVAVFTGVIVIDVLITMWYVILIELILVLIIAVATGWFLRKVYAECETTVAAVLGVATLILLIPLNWKLYGADTLGGFEKVICAISLVAISLAISLPAESLLIATYDSMGD